METTFSSQHLPKIVEYMYICFLSFADQSQQIYSKSIEKYSWKLYTNLHDQKREINLQSNKIFQRKQSQ